MKIYMAVTKDALSLPLAVADSAAELAELRGVQVETIRSLISRGRTGKIKRPGYIVVEVEEDAPRTKDAPPEQKTSRRSRRQAAASRPENLTGRYSGKESDYCGRRAA